MADSLVVGVDNSDASFGALQAAATLAKRRPAALVVVYVEHAPAIAAIGEFTAASADAALMEALEQDAERVRVEVSRRLDATGIDWRYEVASGVPAAELIRIATAHGAIAIIVAGKTHGAVSGLLLGSTADELVRHSPVSVVVVRHSPADDRVSV